MEALLSILQLINHMVNHMCHFPMGSGASRLSSSIQEHHDMEELEVNDLKQEIFYSSNIQVCVHRTAQCSLGLCRMMNKMLAKIFNTLQYM